MIGAVPVLLVIAFAVTALLYASVGFGGGSTYAALLVLSGLDHHVLPLLVLACNITVVAGSTIRFGRARILPWRGALLVTAFAAPAAFLGGLTPIDRTTFLAVLGASLVITGLVMLLPVSGLRAGEPSRFARLMPLVAAPLGYLAGLVGIGGGIFLAPLLHLVRWRGAREIAATASFFILVNSMFGLVGQLLKSGPGAFGAAIGEGLPLLVAVVIGGQAGSLLALKFLPRGWVRGLTALLVMVVGVRLLAGL